MRSRLAATVVLALAVVATAPGSSGAGAVPCSLADTLQAPVLNVGFLHYRPGFRNLDLHWRDLEFLWDTLYVGGLGPSASPVRNTLLKFGSHLVDSTGWNPFGIEVSDMQLVYEYFRGIPAPYTLVPEDTTSVWIGAREIDGYNPSERSHVDIYLHHPTRNYFDGSYPAGFRSGEEDLTTGHVFDPQPLNSISVKGPQEAEKVDEAGTGWTAPGRHRNVIFNHELQHTLLPSQALSFSTELFSALAEAVGGNPDTTAAFASVEVPYTWSLGSTGSTPGLSCENPRGQGSNYQGRSSFGAYLVYNFRGTDTSATLSAIHDDLGRRWARSPRKFEDLRRLMGDDSCGTCAAKDYFHPFGPSFEGEPPRRFALDDTSRLALLLHNWRVAAYVNNSLLAEGQYGYPPHFGFSPARNLRAWQDFNNCDSDDGASIPPEVTVNATHRTRELHLQGSRSFHGGTLPLVLRPMGAEYWVVRADPAIWASGQELVVRVTPLGIHKAVRAGSVCPEPEVHDARLVASLVTYAPPASEVGSGRLWDHPEWAKRALDPEWVDVDSTAGSLEFRVTSFGDTAKAAVIVLSLADGPAQGYSKDNGYQGFGTGDLGEAIRYRVDLSLRTDSQHQTAPQSLSIGRHPTWAPRDTAVAVALGSSILLKSFTGGPDNYISVGHPLNDHRRPDWSPRGDWIALSLRLFGGSTEDVYLQDRLNDYNYRRLTFTAGYDVTAVFQPNGQRLAYTRRLSADTLGTWEIRRVDLAGTNDIVLLSRSGAVLRSPRWGPDGNWIYFLANDSLYAVGADGPNQGVILDVRSRLPRARSFDLPRGAAPLVAEHLGNDVWHGECRDFWETCCSPYAVGWVPQYVPFRRIAFVDTAAVDTIPRFYRTGAEFGDVRWSSDNTRVAYSSPESDGFSYAHVGRPSFNHAPAFANGLLQDAEWGLAAPANFWITASDPDGEPVTFQAAGVVPGQPRGLLLGRLTDPAPGSDVPGAAALRAGAEPAQSVPGHDNHPV